MPSPIEWVAFIFAIITVPLYCFVIFILYKEMKSDSKRSTSFYLICYIVGFVDVVCLLNNYLIYMPPRWNWGTEFYLHAGAPLLRICFFISWAGAMIQLQSTMLITSNRFTALVYAQRHDMLWRNRTLPIMVVMLVPGILLGCGTFLSPVEYLVDSDNVLTQKLSAKEVSKVLYGISGLFLITYTIAIFVIYGVIFVTLRKHQSRQTGVPSTITTAFTNRAAIHKRREMKLLLMSVIVCLIQLVITTYITLKFVIGSSFDEKLNIYNVLVVFYSGLNPYLLISLSEVLRQRALRYIPWTCCFIPRPVTPTKCHVVMTYPKKTTTTNSGC